MIESAAPLREPSLAFLFPPHMLPVIDIFRALGDFEEHYDIGALDALENRLSGQMGRDLAKGIVSDALLLAFGLRRERHGPLDYAPVQSRRATADEYRLMALLAATYWHDFHLASEVAAALEVRHPQPLVSLAFDIARRLESAGLTLEVPDPRLFAVARINPEALVEVTGKRSRSDRRLHRDL